MKKNIKKTKKGRFKNFTEAEREIIKKGIETELIAIRFSASWEDTEAYKKYVDKPIAVWKKLLEELDRC